MRAGGFPYHRTVRRVTDLGILKVWLCLTWFGCFWFWTGLNTPAKSMFCTFSLWDLFPLWRETGDVGIILTNGKRLVPPPCEWSSVNQVAQGWLNSVSGVDKKWGCWWYVGYYSTLLWRKKKWKEEKRVPLGLFDLRAKGNLIHLESQLNATLLCYLTVNLSCFWR